MRPILYNEILKERCNAQALGAYNAAIKSGILLKNNDSQHGKTWTTNGYEVYVSYEEAAHGLVGYLKNEGIVANLKLVTDSGSAYVDVKLGNLKKKIRISGHDVLSMNPNNFSGAKKADYNIGKDVVFGITPKWAKEWALEISSDLRWELNN